MLNKGSIKPHWLHFFLLLATITQLTIEYESFNGIREAEKRHKNKEIAAFLYSLVRCKFHNKTKASTHAS